jgi:ABC-type transport system substrate-binding protein
MRGSKRRDPWLPFVKRTDPSAAVAHGVDALNNSLGFSDPASMFRYFSKTSFSPNGINWGHYADPRVDDLLAQAQQSFDSEQQIELLAQAHAIVVDEAAWAFIVHDLNPRAMSPKVKGFQPGAELVPGLYQGHRRIKAAARSRWKLSRPLSLSRRERDPCLCSL